MAVIKCKMCGGDLILTQGQTVAQCEYCGSRQTVPLADSEKKLTLFARANRLRAACEFDKAAGVYEALVADFPEEAEAYWGLVLCKYGIEYVDDPATGKKIPTCHRSSFDSVPEDSDFEQACENADSAARKVYREEARQMEELRKGIIEVSGREQPYDIFICYKETDENGDRTVDSVIAQDVYDALTDKGYRVFFSRITLEDKLGQEYEPYIFAALNSAKIMLAFGTDYEYFNAVWVKNEWSRYLKLMAKDKTRHLIPCYKGIDAYDMPKEFAKLQAQDMGKVGALQDLLRGIDKLLRTRQGEGLPASGQTAPLLQRCFMFLEEGDWEDADRYCEKVLDMEPQNAQAYLCKLMALQHIRKRENLPAEAMPLEEDRNYQKAVLYGDPELKAFLEDAAKTALRRARLAEKRAVQWAALFEAIQNGSPEQVKKLLGEGADPNCIRRGDESYREYDMEAPYEGFEASPLYDSVYNWPNDEIAELLINGGADVNYVADMGNAKVPVLTAVICRGNIKILLKLLNKGADPNCERVVEDGERLCALYDSIQSWPNDTMARVLIQAGADVNHVQKDRNGTTYPMLTGAISKHNVKMVDYLLENGADPNDERVTAAGGTISMLFDSVYFWPNDEIAELLINAGADVNYVADCTDAQFPVLIGAVSQRNYHIVLKMLAHGANPNCQRILSDGTKHSALYSSIVEWPNGMVAAFLVSRMDEMPWDVLQVKLPRNVTPNTLKKMKRLGCKFKLFG